MKYYWNMSFCDPQIGGIPKSAISFESFFCFNSSPKHKAQLFHICLNQKLFKYTTVLHQKRGDFVPGVGILIVRIFRKVLSISVHVDIHSFSQQSLFRFLPSGPESKISLFSGRFDWKSICFHACVKFPYRPVIPKRA